MLTFTTNQESNTIILFNFAKETIILDINVVVLQYTAYITK